MEPVMDLGVVQQQAGGTEEGKRHERTGSASASWFAAEAT
jgi:hypothetical protein